MRVAPLVFRAPRGLFGPGCLVCPWAAARPRAVRAASFARRVVSKPGQAPPPPTGTAAWPRRSVWASWGSRVLSVWGALVRAVTNVVNPRAFSLKMAVFGLRLTTFVTEDLERRRESRWFDDVCNIGRPLVARPGPVPRSVPYPQFRMQFPDTCSSSLSEKPGISTIIFQSMKCARGNCMRVFGVAGTLIPAGRAAGTREPGWPVV